MPRYPLGQPIRLSTTVRDLTGALVDPSTLTLTVRRSGGATLTYLSPAHDSTGTYHQDIPAADLTAAGHYQYEWVSTGLGAGVSTPTGVFDVFDPAAAAGVRLVSLADAKAFLRLAGTADDALLDLIVGWASARIMREVVAVPITVTETVTARDGCLHLARTPVRTIVAATPLDTWARTVTVTDLVIDQPQYGVVRPSTGPAPYGTYTVTYTAGWDEVPPGVDGACLQLVRHWWNQSQAHGSATFGDSVIVPDFADLPNSVRNMLASVPRPVPLA